MAAGVALLEQAEVMEVVSDTGTDLIVDLTGAVRAGSHGWCTDPGTIAHWPGGLVLAFPASGKVNGTVVLAPGDVNLTFKEYVRDPVTLTVVDDYITAIEGSGVDSELFRSYLAAFEEPEAYAVSPRGLGHEHLGPVGGHGPVGQGRPQRDRAPSIRRQLLVLDRGQRGGRAILPRPL